MGKEKKEKKVLDESHTNGDTSVVEEISYEDRLKFVSVIAHPMASKKLAKKDREENNQLKREIDDIEKQQEDIRNENETLKE